jgi:transmembrane sensor
MVSQLRPQIVAKTETLSSTHFSYETEIGARKKITLADGSSVMLNTNSRIDVDFSANRRDVHLLRGEAFFDVVHNKARPFTVRASNYVVHDIGTAFDVHLSKSGLVEVGVTKGSVEVAPAQGNLAARPAKDAGMLVAGQQIVMGREVARPEAVARADIERKLAWRQGNLIYSGQPLKDVLTDISRYSSIRIELADPALGRLRVGGAFRTDQIEAIFTALENNFGIHAEWISPRHVRFTSNREMPPIRD